MSTDAKSAAPSTGALELRIEVNGDSLFVPSPCTILILLEQLGLGGKRVAVAVNRDVVIRGRHAEFALSEGDHIEILEAVGGG